MKKKIIVFTIIVVCIFITFSFKNNSENRYENLYSQSLLEFNNEQQNLLNLIEKTDCKDSISIRKVFSEIELCRRKLKKIDFWIRYFEPNVYKKINGPLPIEWETEVFEKFEKPYKREGAGLTLAAIYLNQINPEKDELNRLISTSLKATESFKANSITQNLKTSDSFFLCNRLYLLNLATIYSTGFECPNTEQIIPELLNMLIDVNEIYKAYTLSFPQKIVDEKYQNLYNQLLSFVEKQPKDYTKFDHFTFIKDFVNPLFAMNQNSILHYDIVSKSNLDFTLNNTTTSIFDKSLFYAQNTKGVYYRIKDESVLNEMDSIGKLLFYDPILSGNDQRSCVSCHKSNDYLTDTSIKTAVQYNQKDLLSRNTPSLVNVPFNHLIMLDGKLLSLQEQTKTVITNPIEMDGNSDEVLAKVLNCKTYKNAFKKFLKLTPTETTITLDHIVSVITMYYSKFSEYYSPFDEAMNKNKPLQEDEIKGFNLFMSKAQCATCHFSPTFSGIKPPYIGNEFEVLGIPSDSKFNTLDNDLGRYEVNPSNETSHAFRTSTIRNVEKTKPYMHNGVFTTLEDVIDFYDGGAGSGHKLNVLNQTASGDSLHLSPIEKKQLISFIKSLNENIKFEKPPVSLPTSKNKKLNNRFVGGLY